MKEVNEILAPISSYLKTISRDTVKGWYELEVGIPINWVFNENEEIGIEIIMENEVGKLIKIYPKKQNVVIDDLILFVEIIINTNKKIAEKEQEFKKQMEKMKISLEEKAGEFFKELDELKENSFKKLNDNFVQELKERKKRGRKPKEDKPEETITSSGETENHIPAIRMYPEAHNLK